MLTAILAAQVATGTVAMPPRDPNLEHLLFPIFQAKYQIEQHVRSRPQFRQLVQQLGSDACPTYLWAWRGAYRESFAPVRAAYYSAGRKIIPESERKKPGLSVLDEQLLAKYEAPFKAEMKANGGEQAIRDLGSALIRLLTSVAESRQNAGQPALGDAQVDALFQRPGSLCQIDPQWIEEDKK